jgi:probable phosphoglycerate mutase
MKIYLVRHGQSRWQVKRDDEDWDSPLTELGQRQAQHLAAWLADGATVDQDSRLVVGGLCSSPLLRARQTAVALSTTLHQPLTTLDALRESEFLVSAHLPAAESPYQTVTQPTLSDTYLVFKQQADEALRALVEMAESHNDSVLAVAHGGLLSTLLRTAVGSDTVSFWLYNASLNLIEWKRGRWHLVHLNLWDHLPPALRTY